MTTESPTITLQNPDLTPEQRERWQEVMKRAAVSEAIWSYIDDGVLVLELDEQDATACGIYNQLCVMPDGKVGVYSVNQPPFYRDFATLVRDYVDPDEDC